MKKHHSCLNTRAIIEYFQERFPERLPELLEGLGPEIEGLDQPQEFLLEIHNWVSSQVVIRMFENARRITKNEQIAYDIGFQAAARKKLGYVQRLILFAHKNPRRALGRLQALNDKFTLLSHPWPIVRSTIRELERDKELLTQKFEEVQRLNLQLNEKIRQLLCLQKSSSAVLSLLNREEILQVGLELLIRFTKLTRALVLLFQEGEPVLEGGYAAGVAPELWQAIRTPQGPLAEVDELITLATRRGAATILALTPERQPDPTGANRLLRQLGSQALILAPLAVPGRTFGVILADGGPGEAAVTPADKEFVAGFAKQLAIALENARLYRGLEISERKYRELVENAHEGIWIVTNDGSISFANRRMQEILGEDRLIGRNLREFCTPEDLPVMERVLEQNREGKAAQVEMAFISRTRGQVAIQMGSVPWVENGSYRGSFGMFSDLSDRKAKERQLLQQQKMEAVGTLAAGLAHNFNNLLMNIMGLTGLILAHTDSRDPSYGDLKQIEQEVIKGSSLTRQLLSFGRGEEFRTQPLDLNRLVARTTRLFCRTRAEIVLSQSLAPDLPAAEADPGQLEQVLLNLLVNAWQAMSGRGELVLTTEAVWLTEDFCRPQGLAPGRYLHLSLADSGPGMDQATAARIFDPFFTTKEETQGTGLGLATVYAIIKNHRGLIQVASEPGCGTTFHLFLPASDKPAAAESPPDPRIIPGSGTVLLVDDDDSIRMVGGRLLYHLGYEVLAAVDGPQALSLYQTHRDRIALIILDLVMPGMSGWETYQRLKEIDPRALVLVSSGQSSEEETEQFLKGGVQGFIQKPYRLEALSQKIAEILRPERG